MNHSNDLRKTLFAIISQIDFTFNTRKYVNYIILFGNSVIHAMLLILNFAILQFNGIKTKKVTMKKKSGGKNQYILTIHLKIQTSCG
jgi:hypothetical protein